MKKNLVISSIAAIAALNPEGFTVNAATLQPVTSGTASGLKAWKRLQMLSMSSRLQVI